MSETTVTLSDGLPCTVQRLGIFDMDMMGSVDPIGPFIYTFTLANGQVVEDTYDLSKITKPPQHPGVPEDEIEENTPLWHQLLNHQTYKAAVAHEYKRVLGILEYVRNRALTIMERAVSEEDWPRVQTEEDWLKIEAVALVPQITPELIAEAFRVHFHAYFLGSEIFDAVERMKSGSGSFDGIRVWEINTMSAAGFTEEMWADLSLLERVRKVSAAQLPEIMKALETDKQMKEMEAKSRANAA